ncbi:MAG TPA: hypothetical protein VF746_23280 [Longimicrobium sp.]|jgi:hypothetical protein
MADQNLPVTSREYKLMLDTSRFQERGEGGKAYLDLVKFIIEKEKGVFVPQEKIDGGNLEPKTRRTSFLDTPEMGFRGHGFILRVREKKKRQLNLKYRGPDRYAAAVQKVAPVPPAGAELDGDKFEEDVLPAFVSQFSRSASVEKVEAGLDLSTVERVAAVFPGLGELGIPGDTEVVVANGFTAHEVVLHVGGFRFGGDAPVKMALSFWYLQETMTGFPMVGEFSFDYDALAESAGALEQFPLETVKGTERVFRALQLQAGWLDLAGTTKSAFAVSGL